MKLCNLPEEAKSKIKEKLFGVTPPSPQSVPENYSNPRTDTNLGETSWIKSESNEQESNFKITNSSEKISCQTHQDTRRKHSRKHNSSQKQGIEYRSPAYSSNYIKPPKGLF